MSRPKKQDIQVKLACPTARPIQLRYWCPQRKRFVRESTGTYDLKEAEQLRKQREAELLTGTYVLNSRVTWEYFRDEYRALVAGAMKSSGKIDQVLDVVQRIAKPVYLADIADSNMLARIQSALLAGDGTLPKKRKPGEPLPEQARRSPHTVKSYMATLMSALSWASTMSWIDNVPKRPRLKVAKLDPMKGRPLTGEEFERMLAAVPKVLGEEAAESWRYLLRGLWTSALRKEEAIMLSWDDPNGIRPEWLTRGLPILIVPADLQKNNSDAEIPLLPWFEQVLLETPEEQRKGRVFKPLRRDGLGQKLTPFWIGRKISEIGEAANVRVAEANPRTGKKAKFASAHDLRRSCCQRLLSAGVDPLIVQRIMRHSSLAITLAYYSKSQAQKDAQHLREKLGTGLGTPGQHPNPQSS